MHNAPRVRVYVHETTTLTMVLDCHTLPADHYWKTLRVVRQSLASYFVAIGSFGPRPLFLLGLIGLLLISRKFAALEKIGA